MNPLFSLFLFAISLLAIAASCALLMFIYGELQHNRRTREELESPDHSLQESSSVPEAKQVSHFLSKMRAATLIGVSKPRKKSDSDYDKN